MNENVRAFAQDLIDNPPANLAEWLSHEPEGVTRYMSEFDLEHPADPRRVADARKVLPELVRRASLGQTITFKEFVQFLGQGNWRTVGGNYLNPIVALCISQNLPPLWTLVVRAETGLPADFWREHTDRQKASRQQECFEFYGATRAPEGGLREVCAECFTERTPTGACWC